MLRPENPHYFMMSLGLTTFNNSYKKGSHFHGSPFHFQFSMITIVQATIPGLSYAKHHWYNADRWYQVDLESMAMH